MLLPGASRKIPGVDRVGRLRTLVGADGAFEVRWGDVKWDGPGSVERAAARDLREGPPGDDDSGWGKLTDAQRSGWCALPPAPRPTGATPRTLALAAAAATRGALLRTLRGFWTLAPAGSPNTHRQTVSNMHTRARARARAPLQQPATQQQAWS